MAPIKIVITKAPLQSDAIDPTDTETNVRKERDDTDASLRAERSKTDTELDKTATSVEANADQVVEVARERAEATLLLARERADREMTTAGTATELRKEVEAERATEDGVVAEEQAGAKERLDAERDEHQRALSALLRLEREATDDGLLVERTRADEVVSTRDDFLGMVSHDLRNMLGGIAVSASILAKPSTPEGSSNPVTVRHAERIQRFTMRMNRLVGDLLDVVSLEAGKLHVLPRPIDANEIVSEAAEAFHPSFVAQGITLATDLPAGVFLAMCDHDRILQVLANLLGNALKFTQKGGHVALSVARVGSEVRFSITDNGAGIPVGHETEIFERFRQVSTKDRRGLGLGLYIAKCIVEAHEGSIWAESPKAGGATFHFTLPAAGTDQVARN